MIVSIILVVCLSVVAIAFIWPHTLLPIVKMATPQIAWSLSTKRAVIALSFDDGPDPEFTPRILEILKSYGVTATFFVVGERARKFPDLMWTICREGHEIGNHSGTWRPTMQLTIEEFEQDLVRAAKAINIVPCSVPLFRPAGMWISRAQLSVLKQLGYRCVLGSAYGHDPHEPPAGYVRWAISRSLKGGAVVVLHDSGGDRSNTVAALPQIIEAARRRGLGFGRISEFL